MLQIELKKILFYQKGLMTILLCLLAYTVLVLCRGYDSSYLLDRKEDVYLSYMERWQGEITEEKAQEMKTEYDAVNRSNAGIRCYVGKRNLRILHSRTTVAILALLFAVSLSGCARSGKSEITYDFLLDTTQGENTAYSVTLDMVDNKIYAADKQSGETIMLNRNPFPSDKTISSIFVDETACYYCEQGYAGKGFQIYRIDLKDFSERLYFSNTADNTADFWGLNRHSLTEDEILADSGMVSSFMVDGDYIYYLQDKQLWKVCRFTGHETEAISDTGNAESLTYKNGKIVTA